MRITVLGSGSSGNSVLFEAGETRILIDAGLSPRAIRKRLRELDLPVPKSLDGVIVTHAHGDHLRFAQPLQRSFKADLYLTGETGQHGNLIGKDRVTVFLPDTSFLVGTIRVHPYAVPHDAPQVALVLDDGEQRVGLATDLGRASKGLIKRLSECRVVLVESNHDVEMLANGPYPPFLKSRIKSARGHLSNDQTAELLASLKPGVRVVVLMHLSEKNNDPNIALKSARRALRGRGIRIHVARQREPLSFISTPEGQLKLPGF